MQRVRRSTRRAGAAPGLSRVFSRHPVVAASLLKAYGAAQVIHVVNGGVPQWGRLGHPVEA